MFGRIAMGMLLATGLSTASASAATLLSADLAATGDGLLTLDKSTGLEWLDLTVTVGQTRAQVLAGNYVAQGFRYATRNEVIQLWEDGGAVGPFEETGDSVTPANIVPAEFLRGLLGCTSSFNPGTNNACIGPIHGLGDVQNFSIGFYGDGVYDAALIDNFYGEFDPRRFGATLRIDFGPQEADVLLSRVDVGSYLVRAIPGVPEPATWTMLILGFGIIGFSLRRQRDRAMPAIQI